MSSKNVLVSNIIGHAQILTRSLWKFLQTRHRVDYEFRLDTGQSVAAHRILIDAFLDPGQLLDQDTGIGSGCLGLLLEFLYKGEVSVPEKELEGLLVLARKLDFGLLVDAVSGTGGCYAVNRRESGSEGVCGVDPDFRQPEIWDEDDDAKKESRKSAGTRKVVGIMKSDVGSEKRNLRSRVDVGVIVTNSNGELKVQEMEQAPLESRAESERSIEQILRLEDAENCEERKRDCGDNLEGGVKKFKSKSSGKLKQNSRSNLAVEKPGSDEDDGSVLKPKSTIRVKPCRRRQPAALKRCPHCPYETAKSVQYHQHLYASHKVNSKGEPVVKKYKCDLEGCDFACARQGELTKHNAWKHSGQKPFFCVQCPFASSRKGNVVRHAKYAHLGLRSTASVMCETCGHRCLSRSKLAEHRRRHTGEKPHVCGTCEKAYSDLKSYKRHVERHVLPDYKPFCCHVCGFTCNRLDNLKGHLRRVHKTVFEKNAALCD